MIPLEILMAAQVFDKIFKTQGFSKILDDRNWSPERRVVMYLDSLEEAGYPTKYLDLFIMQHYDQSIPGTISFPIFKALLLSEVCSYAQKQMEEV